MSQLFAYAVQHDEVVEAARIREEEMRDEKVGGEWSE